MNKKIDQIKPRNPVARSPLLKKGGAHGPNATSVRQSAQRILQAQIVDWREDVEFENSLKRNTKSE